MKLYNTLKTFYNLRDNLAFKSVVLVDKKESVFYISSKSFMTLFTTNLESIDNIMTFELLACNVLTVNPDLKSETLTIHIDYIL